MTDPNDHLDEWAQRLQNWKELSGLARENLIAEITSLPFLEDFVHVRPWTNREVCDILLEDGHIAIPIEVKTRDISVEKAPGQVNAWVNKVARKAYRQADGAIRTIHKRDVIVTNANRGSLVFKAGDLFPAFGLVLIQSGSSEIILDDRSAHFSRGGTPAPIHYLSIHDFFELCLFLMTLPDLFRYLNFRSVLGIEMRRRLNREEDFMGLYRLNGDLFRPSLSERDLDGAWMRLQALHPAAHSMAQVADETKLPVWYLLRSMRKSNELRAGGSESSRHEHIRRVNMLTRIQRRLVGMMVDIVNESATTNPAGFDMFAIRLERSRDYVVFMSLRDWKDAQDVVQAGAVYYLAYLDANSVTVLLTQSSDVTENRQFAVADCAHDPVLVTPDTKDRARRFLLLNDNEHLIEIRLGSLSWIIREHAIPIFRMLIHSFMAQIGLRIPDGQIRPAHQVDTSC